MIQFDLIDPWFNLKKFTSLVLLLSFLTLLSIEFRFDFESINLFIKSKRILLALFNAMTTHNGSEGSCDLGVMTLLNFKIFYFTCKFF